VAHHCLDLLSIGGLIFVTVPLSYPYHRDPIDTMFRPTQLTPGVRYLGNWLEYNARRDISRRADRKVRKARCGPNVS
jgi:hypothetical protein